MGVATTAARAPGVEHHPGTPADAQQGRRWMVYPLLAGLALSAIGGGYETVRESIDAAAYPCPVS